jgi:hypothetical protein
MAGPIFSLSLISGERIRCSGLYTVTHEAHQLPPQVIPLVAGQIFPPCAECNAPVHFTLVRRMDHLDKLTGNIFLNVLPVLDKKKAA